MKMSVAALALLVLGSSVPLLRPESPPGPETVTDAAGSWDWRPAGTWRQDGRQVDPPFLRLDSADPLHVMR